MPVTRPSLALLLLLACSPAGGDDTGGTAATGSSTMASVGSSSGGTTAVPGDSSSGPGPGPTPTTGDATSEPVGSSTTTSATTGELTDTGATPDLPGESGWHSVLYPEDWTPKNFAPKRHEGSSQKVSDAVYDSGAKKRPDEKNVVKPKSKPPKRSSPVPPRASTKPWEPRGRSFSSAGAPASGVKTGAGVGTLVAVVASAGTGSSEGAAGWP